MLIGLTYDLREEYLAQGFSAEETAEFDKIETVEAIESALRQMGFATERIGNILSLNRELALGKRWDLVFNICEGLYGFAREAQVPALLDAYKIPCTFSDPMVLGLALHKGLTKNVIRDQGIPTPDFAVVERPEDALAVNLPFPLFAKPVAEGTSKGVSLVSRVNNREELEASCKALLLKFNQPVLVETYLPGREFTIGIIGTGADAIVLGAMEVLLNSKAESGIYSYHNKENYKELVEYRSACDPVAGRAKDVALASWRAIRGRDVGRVDIRVDKDGLPNFLEVNPLPGLHPVNSDLPILARLNQIDYQQLLEMIMSSVLARIGEMPLEAHKSRATRKAHELQPLPLAMKVRKVRHMR
ncbi:MAG: D-alanine--D-alanine ligase [Candidatus Wallbacteria bacterium]|nr:D-alanine--D-alanine ligase [Candidatus Wallbacteria bacterium]